MKVIKVDQEFVLHIMGKPYSPRDKQAPFHNCVLQSVMIPKIVGLSVRKFFSLHTMAPYQAFGPNK